jgi:hypothetical protein
MTGILDRFAQARTNFQPASMDELFALVLACRLGDESAAEHYAALVAEHLPERLVHVYHRALKAGWHGGRLAAHFHAELKNGNAHIPSGHPVPLLAIKVERRSVAAAVFIGRHLEDVHVRHLSSVASRAQSSAVGFINWIMSNFPIESAALECIVNVKDIRRVVLTNTIREGCIAPRPISLWQYPKHKLFETFGFPALRSRKQLRQVVLSMWPVLADKRADQVLDAAALGALVQTERLFLN